MVSKTHWSRNSHTRLNEWMEADRFPLRRLVLTLIHLFALMPRPPGKKNIPPATRVALVLHLAAQLRDGRLPRGAINASCPIFNVGRRTVSKIWALRSDPAKLLPPPSSRQSRRLKRSSLEIAQRIEDAPLHCRKTMRSLAAATGIPRASLQRYLAKGEFRRVCSRVKPELTPSHKKKRLEFALARVERPIGIVFYFN